jgi:hypothetical protein
LEQLQRLIYPLLWMVFSTALGEGNPSTTSELWAPSEESIQAMILALDISEIYRNPCMCWVV